MGDYKKDIFMAQYRSLFEFEQRREQITIQIIITLGVLLTGWGLLFKNYNEIHIGLQNLLRFYDFPFLKCPNLLPVFLYSILNLFIFWIFSGYIYLQTYHYRMNFFWVKVLRRKYRVKDSFFYPVVLACIF